MCGETEEGREVQMKRCEEKEKGGREGGRGEERVRVKGKEILPSFPSPDGVGLPVFWLASPL